MVGVMHEAGGLYHLDASSSPSSAFHSESIRNKESVMRWHSRLGHVSLPYLRLVVPCVFQSGDIVELQCETCQ